MSKASIETDMRDYGLSYPVSKQTNADAIRNMSDEELAKRIFLEFDVKDVCRFCIPTMRTEGKCDGRCKSGILQWLQAEVKEGNSN